MIFIVLDHQPEREAYLEQITLLQAKLDFMPIIVTDTKDAELLARLNDISSSRVMQVQRSGASLSALLCVVPL